MTHIHLPSRPPLAPPAQRARGCVMRLLRRVGWAIAYPVLVILSLAIIAREESDPQ